MKKFIISVCLCTVLTIKVSAQEWKFIFPEYKDLLSSNVLTIAEDNNGITWFGTNMGFASFDGTTWKQYKKQEYSLPDSVIRQIVVDKDNNKWMATGKGLIKVSNNTVYILNKSNSVLPSDYIVSIAVDDSNNVWVITFDDLTAAINMVKLGKNKTELIKTPKVRINKIRCDKNGNIWGACDEAGLMKYNKKEFVFYKHRLSDRLLNVSDFDFGKNNEIWIGGNFGIYKLLDTTFTPYLTISDGQKTISTFDWRFVSCDSEGNVWFNNENGLIKYNGENYYEMVSPQISRGKLLSIQNISFTKNNRIWIGTNTEGAVKIENGVWTNYDTSYGLPCYPLYCIKIDKNDVKWIGTYKGLAKLDGNKWSIFNICNSPIPENIVNDIAIDKHGTVWIGTLRGLAKYDGINWTIYTKENCGLVNNLITAITTCEDTVWVGTDNGLSKFDGKNWITFTSENSVLPGDRIHSIVVDKNNAKWISISWWGVYKYIRQSWSLYTTSNSGLPSNMFLSSFVDELNRKWFGTSAGLAVFDDVNWKVYNKENTGVNLYEATSIKTDKNGKKVFGLYWSQGLVIFDGNTWKPYNTKNTFTGVNVNCMDLDVDSFNNIWIPDLGGLAIFNEDKIITGIKSRNPGDESKSSLLNVYPNPFNLGTKIQYTVAEPGIVVLKIFNMLGQLLVEKKLGEKTKGVYEEYVSAKNLSSGTYICQMSITNNSFYKKILLVK